MTLQFIELYKKHEHLWDRSHPEYRRAVPRQMSLNVISSELNVPIKELTHKIHRLQTQYNAWYKKAKMAPNEDAAEAVRTHWPFYEKMRFMEKSYLIMESERTKKKGRKPAKRPARSKKTTNTSAITRSAGRTNTDHEYSGFAKVEQEAECIISDDDDEDDEHWSDDCYIACSSRLETATASFASTNNLSVKYESERMIPTSTTAAAAATAPIAVSTPVPAPSAVSVAQSNDRIDAFFKAMADTVKSFPNKNIAEAKLRISQIVGEMELSLATEDEVLVTNF